MKKLNLSELKVKSKKGKSKTRKYRKRRKRWNFFPSFLLPSFQFWVLGQNRKVGRKKAGKTFARFLTFPRFPSFRPGL